MSRLQSHQSLHLPSGIPVGELSSPECTLEEEGGSARGETGSPRAAQAEVDPSMPSSSVIGLEGL